MPLQNQEIHIKQRVHKYILAHYPDAHLKHIL